MRKCVLCGAPVGQGDRHAKNSCPPPRGKKRSRKRNPQADLPRRGAVVAGTGVPKGE